MTAKVALEADELAEIRAILARHLPADIEVHVFGSRAGGRVKPWSDLDLVLDAGARLSDRLLADLAKDFDESRLAWKVDLVDRAAISPAFARIVDAGKLPLPTLESQP